MASSGSGGGWRSVPAVAAAHSSSNWQRRVVELDEVLFQFQEANWKFLPSFLLSAPPLPLRSLANSRKTSMSPDLREAIMDRPVRVGVGRGVEDSSGVGSQFPILTLGLLDPDFETGS